MKVTEDIITQHGLLINFRTIERKDGTVSFRSYLMNAGPMYSTYSTDSGECLDDLISVVTEELWRMCNIE